MTDQNNTEQPVQDQDEQELGLYAWQPTARLARLQNGLIPLTWKDLCELWSAWNQAASTVPQENRTLAAFCQWVQGK